MQIGVLQLPVSSPIWCEDRPPTLLSLRLYSKPSDVSIKPAVTVMPRRDTEGSALHKAVRLPTQIYLFANLLFLQLEDNQQPTPDAE